MSTFESSDSPTPQALRPLYLPAMTTLNPAEHYHGGLPIRATEAGVQVNIPAWQTMNINDKVELFWNNAPAPLLTKTIDLDSEVNRDVVLTVPKGEALDGDIKSVFYRLTRKNQTPEDSTPQWTLLAKSTRPGGYDDNPVDDGHSGLTFSLDRTDIDPTLPAQGVTMTINPYLHLTKYDRILARWASQQVVHIVTPEQALDPLNNPIKVVFSRALIEAAGDGDKIKVAFQVICRCGNFPDETAPWSAVTDVVVDLGGNRLGAPLVLVNGAPVNSIDLAALKDTDANVRVYTMAPDFAVGDEVTLTWFGTPAQGSQIIVGPLKQTVSFVPFQLEFIIPNAAIKAIAKGSASVGYVRSRAGEPDRPSKNTSVAVTGDISRLAAPTVTEATGGTLPPETPWAEVKIPWYAGRHSSDEVTLVWIASAPGGGTVYYDDARPVGSVPDNEPILRSVSNANIRRFDGLQVKVYYIVTNSETALLSVRESLPFMMQVGVASPTFDAPIVEEAEGDVLDPANVPPSGATVLMPYLGTQDKDVVTMLWRGWVAQGTTSVPITLTSATAGRPLRFTIDKQYVTKNEGDRVKVSYTIQRGGVPLGGSEVLSLQIRGASAHEDFESGVTGSVSSGIEVDFPTLTATPLTSGLSIYLSDSTYSPAIIGKCWLISGGGGTLKIKLKRSAKTVKFGIGGSVSTKAEVKCYDSNFNLIFTRQTPPFNQENQTWAVFSDPEEKEIGYLQVKILSSATARLDNLTMTY